MQRLREFLAEGLWELDLRGGPRWRAAGLGVLRVAIHTARAFAEDLGGLRAAGLALLTLLAVVPLLALVSGIAKGLGYGAVLDDALADLWRNAPPDMQPAIDQIRALVERTSFGALGVIGSLLLAYSGLMLYVRVEQSFNRIWRVPKSRSWTRRVTDFIAMIILVPVLVLAGMSLQSLLASATWFRDVVWLQQLYDTWLGLVPFVLVWIAFSAAYRVMPSAPVRWTSALVAGVAAGSAWLFVHGLYVSAQISVARLNAIYATLAALPLLLIYLHVTWTIVLVGAEIGYAFQNRNRLQGPRPQPPAPAAIRARLGLALVARASAEFARGARGCKLEPLADELGVRPGALRSVADQLVKAGFLGEVGTRLVPMRPPEQISVAAVFAAIQGEVGESLRAATVLPPSLEQRLQQIEAAPGVLDGCMFEDGSPPRERAP